jgi:hypothetical protein
LDTVRLRYLGEHRALVTPLGREVEPEELVTIPGRMATSEETAGQPADSLYIVSGNPPVLRAWAESLWRNETPATASAKEKGK